jgi:hypothetical protein
VDAAAAMDVVGATDAADLLVRFLVGTGDSVDYPDESTLSKAIKKNSQFIALDKVVQAVAAEQFNTGLTAAQVTPKLTRLNFSACSPQ